MTEDEREQLTNEFRRLLEQRARCIQQNEELIQRLVNIDLQIRLICEKLGSPFPYERLRRLRKG